MSSFESVWSVEVGEADNDMKRECQQCIYEKTVGQPCTDEAHSASLIDWPGNASNAFCAISKLS